MNYNPLGSDTLHDLFSGSTDETSNLETSERLDITTPLSVYNKLKSLNPKKASGPDGISNWVLKEYAELLANPISDMLNASYNEEKLPSAWKQGNVIPLPKEKLVRHINKHLQPISLTKNF
jgi:hypothetical protein